MDQISRGQQIVFADSTHRRLRAFHECGHAAWLFLDGRMSDIVGISIAPRRTGDGSNDIDTGVCEYLGQPYSREWVEEGDGRKTQLSRATRAIAFSFAGPVSEYHEEDCESAANMWTRVLYDWWGTCEPAVSFDDNPSLLRTDFGSALAAAYHIYPTARERLDDLGKQAYGFLEKVFNWTHELFTMAEVLSLVHTLAAEFEPSNVDEISGDRARELLRESWHGDSLGVPLESIGKKWVRRVLREGNAN